MTRHLPPWPQQAGIRANLNHFWQRLGGQIRPTLALAAPVMVARTGVVFLFVVDSLMVGRAGGTELAAFGQAVAPQSVMMLISIGLLQGSMILISQAYGAKEWRECGRTWQASMLIAIGLGACFFLLSFLVEPFLLLTGTEATLARDAGAVSLQFAWGIPGMLLYIASNYFLESIKRPQIGMMIMMICNALNLAADGILVAGWGGFVTESWGAPGAVFTTSALRWLAFLLALCAILWTGEVVRFGVWPSLRGHVDRVKHILRLGGPVAVALGTDQAAFATIVIMAGHMGASVAAAHQLTSNFTTLLLMIAVGLSAATSIRVGHAVGAEDAPQSMRAGITGIGLALAITLLLGFGLLLLPQSIASLYTPEPQVIAIATSLLMVGGLVIVLDGTLTVTMGALRGLGDTFVPAILHAGSYWLIGVPAAYALGFPGGLGAPGLMLGLAAGIAMSFALLSWRFVVIVRRPVHRA
ncbi:MAG: MATE family efflux transporter [Alphaproteobacteria bacterium]|nr:MATE family efflux transporter [Alphaproteobacteria bacterium]